MMEIFTSICFQLFFNKLNASDFSRSSLIFSPVCTLACKRRKKRVIKGKGNIQFISSFHFWVVLLSFNFMYLHLNIWVWTSCHRHTLYSKDSYRHLWKRQQLNQRIFLLKVLALGISNTTMNNLASEQMGLVQSFWFFPLPK